MLSIRVRNVNEALPLSMMHLRRSGVYVTSRGMQTLEYPTPVTTTYEFPQERVLFSPERDANPFFHLMEALWIIAGRQDVAFIEQFNRRMAEYSDNGKTFHAPYGYRLRHMMLTDQIEAAIDLLRRKPDTRQCVLHIWNADLDLGSDSKDIPCVTGDTKFMSPETSVSARKLAWMFKTGFITRYPVYGMDPATGETKITWMTNCWKSGRKKILRVEFSDGSILKCTSDHRLWIRVNGQAVETEAGALQPGYTMMAVKRNLNGRGHLQFKRNAFGNTAFSNMVKEHTEYMRLLLGCDIPEGLTVHHLLAKTDNRKGAISLMTVDGHNAYHRIVNNPMRGDLGNTHAAMMRGEDVDYPAERFTHPDLSTSLDHAPTVVSVDDWGEADVFDFTVPETSNAALDNGVFVHNCNDLIMLKVRDGELNMTVACRSNDAIWGAYGANAVQFSMLLEYIAQRAGYEVGVYRQVSDSLHVYVDNPQWEKLRYLPPMPSKYDTLEVKPFPLGADHDLWDYELDQFLSDPFGDTQFTVPFFSEVVQPMAIAWRAHKEEKRGVEALSMRTNIDWLVAGREWMERRES